MFGRAFKDALEAEKVWLEDHLVEYELAVNRMANVPDLRDMLDGAALALASLQCLTNESSVLMAGQIIGTAEAELERALSDRTTVQSYESRKANYESMLETGSPLPELGLGAVRGERDR